ncbi:MAG TPA: peptidyl-tRNA hydrolase Pth2 [Thermoplasmata archaeon]|nr:peptidyl-tRNA hydrolase Pth2 [Thermoplasmata archaeon]
MSGGMKHKLVVAVRGDLDLSRGKLAVQVAHAAVMAALDAKTRHRKAFSDWYDEGQKKVVVKAADLQELHELQRKARSLGLTTALVEDAGLTELPPGTVTCLAVGPGPNALVDQVTGQLRLV